MQHTRIELSALCATHLNDALTLTQAAYDALLGGDDAQLALTAEAAHEAVLSATDRANELFMQAGHSMTDQEWELYNDVGDAAQEYEAFIDFRDAMLDDEPVDEAFYALEGCN